MHESPPTTTYADGTTGWSGSSTSRERAEREVRGRRQQQVYRHLLRAGVVGRTCAEIEGDLGIGHGSASSALTGLHRGRHIVRLTQRRNGQEVYVVAHHQQGREESPYRPNSASKKELEERIARLESGIRGAIADIDARYYGDARDVLKDLLDAE